MNLKSKVIILGSGTCRIDPKRVESSMCFIDGETTFLFDCGSGVPRRLVEAGGLENCKTLHIHLSHSHIDHFSGVFGLLHCLTFSDDNRDLKVEDVVIHSAVEVKEIIQNALKLFGSEQSDLIGLYSERNRILRFESFGNEEDSEYRVKNVLVKTVHLPRSYNHGVRFNVNSVEYAITGDSTEFNDNLIDFCKNADRVLFDFGHLTNVRNGNQSGYSLENVAHLLNECKSGKFYAGHVYLRSFENIKTALSYDERNLKANKLISEVLALAVEFVGELMLAEDLLEI